MKTILMLDLEETIIDEFHKGTVINTKIRKWIKAESFDSIGIFSFAIWDAADKEWFNKNLREHIENIFHIKFDDSLLITVEDLRRIICSTRFIDFNKLDTVEFVSLFSKELSFFFFVDCLVAKAKESIRIVLVDDTININSITTRQDGSIIELVNPVDIGE